MRLTEEQKEKLEMLLSQRWVGSQSCWICGAEDWSLSERVFEIREHGGGMVKLDGATIPLIMLTCSGCGNTLVFNLMALGLF